MYVAAGMLLKGSVSGGGARAAARWVEALRQDAPGVARLCGVKGIGLPRGDGRASEQGVEFGAGDRLFPAPGVFFVQGLPIRGGKFFQNPLARIIPHALDRRGFSS